MRNKRLVVKCRVCSKRWRTRKKRAQESQICDDCVDRSISANLDTKSMESDKTSLSWEIMPESWFHSLIYRQVESNGLVALGMGKLMFVDGSLRNDTMMGQFIDKRNRYDLFLQVRHKQTQPVCVEVKRVADEAAVVQALRYHHALKERGAIIAIVTIDVTEPFLGLMDEIWSAGFPIRVYRLCIDSGITLTELKRGEGDQKEV